MAAAVAGDVALCAVRLSSRRRVRLCRRSVRGRRKARTLSARAQGEGQGARRGRRGAGRAHELSRRGGRSARAADREGRHRLYPHALDQQSLFGGTGVFACFREGRGLFAQRPKALFRPHQLHACGLCGRAVHGRQGEGAEHRDVAQRQRHPVPGLRRRRPCPGHADRDSDRAVVRLLSAGDKVRRDRDEGHFALADGQVGGERHMAVHPAAQGRLCRTRGARHRQMSGHREDRISGHNARLRRHRIPRRRLVAGAHRSAGQAVALLGQRARAEAVQAGRQRV